MWANSDVRRRNVRGRQVAAGHGKSSSPSSLVVSTQPLGQASANLAPAVNLRALGQDVWRLCGDAKDALQQEVEAVLSSTGKSPPESSRARANQILRHVADAAQLAISSTSAASLTAATLQLAATNVPATALPSFYSAVVQRALQLLPHCSLQQRALDPCGSSVSRNDGLAEVLGVPACAERREQMHAMANALQRLCKAGLLVRSDGLVDELYRRMVPGVLQVPLDEIPGALAKCASASTASWSASIRSKSDPSGLQLALPSAAVVSAWREQFKGAEALNSSRLNEDRVVFDAQGPWTALQYAFATAAAAHVATAMPSTLERFASRIIELRIPQDHPVVASAAVALQDALTGSTAGDFMHPRLFDADMPFKLLARLAQTLAWAGLATSDSMSALSCEAALQLRSDPPRSAMMLADGALQFANAGCHSAELFARCARALAECKSLQRERPAFVARIAAKFAAAGIYSVEVQGCLSRALCCAEARQSDGQSSRGVPNTMDRQIVEALRFEKVHPALPVVTALLARAAWRLPPPPPLLRPEPDSPALHEAMRDALQHLDWRQRLVVDAGCGFGSFALGVAKLSAARERSGASFGGSGGLCVDMPGDTNTRAAAAQLPSRIDSWNVLGIDMQPSAVARARAAALREGLHLRLAYTEMEATSVFAWLEQHYPGDIVLLHVGFPTPFPVRQQQGQATAGSACHAEAPPPHPQSSYSQAANVAGDARERGVCGRELPAVHGKPTFLVQGEFVQHGARMLCSGGAVYVQSNVAEVAQYTLEHFSAALGVSTLAEQHQLAEAATYMAPTSSADVLSAMDLVSSSGDAHVEVESESECISRLKGREVFRWCLQKRC